MASPLVWKVYDKDRKYMGAAREAYGAAVLVALYGTGSVIKVDGRIVWREGGESQLAGQSYDYLTQVVHRRRRQHWDEHRAIYGQA